MTYHDVSWHIMMYHDVFVIHIMTYHDKLWHIMIYHDTSWYIMTYHDIWHKDKKHHFVAKARNYGIFVRNFLCFWWPFFVLKTSRNDMVKHMILSFKMKGVCYIWPISWCYNSKKKVTFRVLNVPNGVHRFRAKS